MNPIFTIFLAQDRIADLHRAVDPHVPEGPAANARSGRVLRLRSIAISFARHVHRSTGSATRMA